MLKTLLFCLTFLSFPVFSQDYKAIANSAACKSAITKNASATKSLKADFTEKTYSSMLKTPASGSGSVLYKKQDKIRWEHKTPTPQVILISGSSFKMKDNGQEVKNAGANKVAKKIQELMMTIFTGSFINEKEFTVSYFENTANYKLVLVPKNARMKKYIASIEMIFDKKKLTMNQLTLAENATNKIVYSFSNITLNTEIADSKFTTF